ncbi:hypothetical protein Tcan_12894 [Toxocara canis]|uniref:Uncharacterized protein n=1 Tax=Toxocara canis TaxID=6265 RepID=A0A0B2W4T1_TOXCA|nr:hypothetical protein Tcan_12894 [Toxocara canis]
MVESKASYSLKTKDDQLSPFGFVAQGLLNMVRKLKGKTPSQKFEAVLEDIQKTHQKIEEKKAVKKLVEEKWKLMYGLKGRSKNGAFAKVIKTKGDMNEASGLKDGEGSSSMSAATDVSQQILAEQMKFIRQVAQLAKVVGGDNGTDIGMLTMFSPRILSITPEEARTNTVNLLSPSLLSLHDKGKGLEALLSVPNAIKAIDSSDYRQWMDLIIEASGVPDAIEKAHKYQVMEVAGNLDDAPRGIDGQPMHFNKENVSEILGDYERRKIDIFEELQANFTEKQKYQVMEVAGNLDDAPRGIDGQPMHFNKENVSEILGDYERRKIDIFEELQANFTEKQFMDFKHNGYSILTKDQAQQIYGEHSPYNDSATLELFNSMSEVQIRRRLEVNLRELQKASTLPTRAKRQRFGIVLSPVLLTAFINDAAGVSLPLILSPVALAPLINSPSLFGLVLLSPWVLVPLVNSPRILSPTILSPVTLATVILSPLTFNPFILAPGALLPVILSPLLLDPFILSPQACTPLILSPLALSPFIFNPTIFSPIILSPFVLTPSVFSPAYVSALVLSPHAFSPLINSTGKFVAVVLSPNAFS